MPKLGILAEGDETVTGAEVEGMSDEELRDRVKNISVYARVAPQHKVRIVKAWQDWGQVVAMTGMGSTTRLLLNGLILEQPWG